jgi:hypothetical protein
VDYHDQRSCRARFARTEDLASLDLLAGGRRPPETPGFDSSSPEVTRRRGGHRPEHTFPPAVKSVQRTREQQAAGGNRE